jgi:hypothetical protein
MNKIQQTRVSKDSLLRSVILSFSTPNLYLLESPFYHFRGGYSFPNQVGRISMHPTWDTTLWW